MLAEKPKREQKPQHCVPHSRSPHRLPSVLSQTTGYEPGKLNSRGTGGMNWSPELRCFEADLLEEEESLFCRRLPGSMGPGAHV